MSSHFIFEKWNKTNLLLVTIIALTAFRCERDNTCPDNAHNGIEFKNESDQPVYFEVYWNYPDTVIGEYNPTNQGNGPLQPSQSTVKGAGRQHCWESYFMRYGREWVYFFNADTIEKLDWGMVRKTQRGLLERRAIDLDYLKANNFKIVYQ
jgi:hypothetical protein